MLPKQERIKKLLRDSGLDGAIISSPENFHYIAGFAGHQHTVSRQPGFSVAVMSADDSVKTHLITMDFELPTFKLKTKDFELRAYDTWVGVREWKQIVNREPLEAIKPMKNSMEMLLKSVDDLGLTGSNLGVELDYLSVNYYNQLLENLPKASFSNISNLFIQSRSVKTVEEIDMFRRLCTVADNAFNEVSKIAAVGVSEKELSDTFRNNVVKSGFCLPSSWSMFSTGANASRLTLPENRIARDGEVIKFDAGVNAETDFYTTDTSRSWIVGNADPELKKLKDRLYTGQRKMIETARPGLPINELFKIGLEWVQAEYPSYKRGHLGHSISMGPATAEAPYINATETRPLEAGMILAIEVPCYISGYNGLNIEDMVLITKDGCEVLTPLTPHYI